MLAIKSFRVIYGTCPRCTNDKCTLGVSHSGSGAQWECHNCGFAGLTVKWCMINESNYFRYETNKLNGYPIEIAYAPFSLENGQLLVHKDEVLTVSILVLNQLI